MSRLSFRCDDELVRRVDEMRGDVPRERWLRSRIERLVENPHEAQWDSFAEHRRVYNEVVAAQQAEAELGKLKQEYRGQLSRAEAFRNAQKK